VKTEEVPVSVNLPSARRQTCASKTRHHTSQSSVTDDRLLLYTNSQLVTSFVFSQILSRNKTEYRVTVHFYI